jgi:hypothetical protein
MPEKKQNKKYRKNINMSSKQGKKYRSPAKKKNSKRFDKKEAKKI